MRILWLTLADPDPTTNGQFLYSSGLIRSVAPTSHQFDVIGLGRPGGGHYDGQTKDSVRWMLAKHRPRTRLRGLLSTLPFVSFRTTTADVQALVRNALNGPRPDAIVFDSIALGWALPRVLARWPDKADRPRLAYIAHNDETGVAWALARAERNPLKKLYKVYDAMRVARLELTLARGVDLVTSNTQEDRRTFAERRDGRPVDFLPPGYDGRRLASRHIDADTPRRAVILGSFQWAPKRRSLEEFLTTADPLFAKAGIELLIIGNASGVRPRQALQATRFIGFAADPDHILSEARMALVLDRVGGFKLKVLDYVFKRLPILSLLGSLPGVPLVHGDSAMMYPSDEALAKGVVDAMDDLELLNGIQDQAYRACAARFDWPAIGQKLRDGLTGQREAGPRHAAFRDVVGVGGAS